MTASYTGSCLCGGVRFEVDEFREQISDHYKSMVVLSVLENEFRAPV